MTLFQDNIEVQFNQIITKELLDGQILTQVTLIPGKINRVQHKLGRQIEGWTIVRKRADARVWDVQDCEGNKSVYLALIVSHEVEVDIWVF